MGRELRFAKGIEAKGTGKRKGALDHVIAMGWGLRLPARDGDKSCKRAGIAVEARGWRLFHRVE